MLYILYIRQQCRTWWINEKGVVNKIQNIAHVLNAIAPHPYDLCLATAGIDSGIKLWSPTASEPRSMRGPAIDAVLARNEDDNGCFGEPADIFDMAEDY